MPRSPLVLGLTLIGLAPLVHAGSDRPTEIAPPSPAARGPHVGSHGGTVIVTARGALVAERNAGAIVRADAAGTPTGDRAGDRRPGHPARRSGRAARSSVRGRDGAVVDGEPAPASTSPDRPRQTIDALPLRGRRVSDAIPAPRGDLVALRMSADALALSSRPVTDAFIGMFDAAANTRLWTAPLGPESLLAWSADGTRVALHDGVELAILDARTGDGLYVRSDLGAAYERVAD